MYSGGEQQSQGILKMGSSEHPVFPGQGVLVLGQEQETICGGFDDYDSLSADISEFQVRAGTFLSLCPKCAVIIRMFPYCGLRCSIVKVMRTG